MIIFKRDGASKMSCGINDDGMLFVGDASSGEIFRDTEENRKLVLAAYQKEVDLYRLEHGIKMIPADIVEKLDGLIDMYVTQYKTDWTVYDRPRVLECRKSDSFAVMLRDSGIDTLFLKGDMVSYDNLLWAKACAESERNKLCLIYEDGELSETNSEALADRCKKILRSLPDDYVNACEDASYKHAEMPKLEDWKDDSGYNKKKQRREKAFSR